MSYYFKKIVKFIQEHNQITLKLLLLISMPIVSAQVLADPSDDILSGTTTALVATLKGSGKTYLYIAEGVLSLAAYIKTKNLLFLAGIVVVSIFFNVMMKVAGI